MCIISALPGILTEDVLIVLNLAGAITVPIMGFYLPIVLNLMADKIYPDEKRGILLKIHDFGIILLSMVIQFMALRYSIVEQFGL